MIGITFLILLESRNRPSVGPLLGVNRGVLGYNLYAVVLLDGVDILTIDGNRFSNNNDSNEYNK